MTTKNKATATATATATPAPAFVLTKTEINKLLNLLDTFDKVNEQGVAFVKGVYVRAEKKGVEPAKRNCPIKAAIIAAIGERPKSTVYRWIAQAMNPESAQAGGNKAAPTGGKPTLATAEGQLKALLKTIAALSPAESAIMKGKALTELTK